MFNRYLIFAWFLILAIGSCKEEQTGPLENDGVAPASVSNVKVQNLAGSAKLTYTLPPDEDLAYILAEYVNKNGTKWEFKSSSFNNAILVEGFADASAYEVTLYSVDRSENRSEPLKISVNPLTPPVVDVFNSLVTGPTFGGIFIKFQNPTEANVVITTLTDSLGKWIPVTSSFQFYTSNKEGVYSIRGYDDTPRKFAVSIKDKWGNLSDTLKIEETPFLEEQISSADFRPLLLPTDVADCCGWIMPNMWNGSLTGSGFHTQTSNIVLPHWFSFDLGAVYKLSRFKNWQRGVVDEPSYLFWYGNYKEWEIWGRVTPPTDGSWDGWTKLSDLQSIKPSGSGNGIVTAADRAYALEGEDYEMPLDAPPVRYLRFKIKSVWQPGLQYSHSMEMRFWGNKN